MKIIFRSFLLNPKEKKFPIRIPKDLWHDKAIVIAVLKVFPEALLLDLVPDPFLNDKDVFLAYMTPSARPQSVLPEPRG